MRSAADRVAGVSRLLAAAERVYRQRAASILDIARTTGLTVEGVELGFECLEREASADDLRSLVQGAGTASHVHVILSANVFVAPLRALAVARAAAERVTIRPSPRDPVLAQALVREAGDEAIRIDLERDVAAVDATEIHVYGRDATISEVRARARTGVTVRGHGAGMGVALVTGADDVELAAKALAVDVVLFDQRGCLSPRVVVAIGDATRGRRLLGALHRQLEGWGARVPRGELRPEERAEAARWVDTMRFAGSVSTGPHHAVGIPAEPSLLVPPAGRHVLVVASETLAAARAALAPLAAFVVVVGCNDPGSAAALVPSDVRIAALGRMQRPPLDGPVDRRGK
jgi:hypothetical protein